MEREKPNVQLAKMVSDCQNAIIYNFLNVGSEIRIDAKDMYFTKLWSCFF